MSQDQLNIKEEASIKELITPYTRKWIWFVISLITALIIAFIYLRYTIPNYETKAIILIKENIDNGLSNNLAHFSNMSIFKPYNKGKLENELATLRSRRIISLAIENLDLNTKYEAEGRVITSELYENSPIQITYLKLIGINENASKIPSLQIKITSENQYELAINDEIIGNYYYGDKVSLDTVEFMITPNDDIDKNKISIIDNNYIISYTGTTELALAYQEQLEILNKDQISNIVTIGINSFEVEKAEDFINKLVNQYNLGASYDQNLIAQKTANFIDERIEIITRDLDSVESGKEIFKIENRLTNIDAEAQLVLAGVNEFNSKQIDLQTQIKLVSSMLEYFNSSETIQLLPSNIVIEGEELETSINTYNQLVLERNRLLRNSTEQNPIIINIDDHINELKSNLIISLQNYKDGLQVSLRGFNDQENRFNSRLSEVPAQEKIFRDIVRQQEIKEQLYIFLLKQKEEASIKLASTTLKAKVIDAAFTSSKPISPKKDIIFLGAGLIGLLIPFLVIYIRELLNTSVENRKDVEKELKDFSLIGEIPRIKKDSVYKLGINDRSVLAESFRILRTNLQFFFFNKKTINKYKTVFVTSTIKGEGKTLVAFNLALTISFSGKKVALVGADIRNPKLQRYLPKNLEKHHGLTEYIMRTDIGIDEVIAPSDIKNLDIVLSGTIPPNPAEFLMQERVGTFFEELNHKYDYIIVDTAPAMLVTDTLLINKYADVTLYVIKANYTDKKLLEFLKEAVKEGSLKNVALVLNGVAMNNFGYGNKYRYAYSKEKPSLKERIFG